ncbi:hypothetical protein MKX79_13275 [Viridibacillus sp. FSL R5-0468]|uniref:hypothetical protein n=1 Tax=Viridibacillus sp. FSL R5-0468 TaxID=2921640 RepID=UPI0030F79C10
MKSENEQKLNYENWVDEQIDLATGDEKTELLNSYKQYKELSNEEQEKFVEYLYNPQVQEQMIDALSTVPKNSSRSLQGGDIEVTGDTPSIEHVPGKAKAANATNKATYKRGIEVLGVRIFESTIWVEYSYSNCKITGSQTMNAYTSLNFNPLLSSSYSTKTVSNTGLVVVVSSKVNYSYIYQNLVYTKNGTISIWADVNDNSGGSFVEN